jgi:peroxiredoxin Q/BCP
MRFVLILSAVLASSACGSTDPAASASGGGENEAPPARTGLLEVGATAPDFSAPDQTGTTRTLAAERGHPVVLYFYPRDATPGCTREACAFRDAWSRYEAVGAQVFGVSSDDVESHRRFAEEHQLPFPLLADTESRIADAYGVPHPAGFMQRVTFLIGADGTVARVFPSVDPGVHADDVLEAIAALPAVSALP